MKKILMHTGRVFLALYFLIPGISKFTSWSSSASLMEAHNMPLIPLLLMIAGTTQVVGSISLLLNKYVVFCALGFAVMTILINLNLHDFWNTYEGVNSEREAQNFFKNLGIFAGLLLLAAVNIEDSKSS
jgi:putative oxidoreductase